MRFHSADGARRANGWDLERHTSPFEVELTNRLMGGHRTSRPSAGVSFRRCRVQADSVFSLSARLKLYSIPVSMR